MRIGELSLDEIVIDERDLQSYMTAGIVVSGTNLDLLRLKTVLYQIEEKGDLKIIHFQITPEHLRVVKREEWEDWINKKK